MAPPRIQIAPALIAEGKRLYEQTMTPVEDIAAMMGVKRWTFNNRAREWGWTRRRHPSGPIDLVRAVRGTAVAVVTDPSGGAIVADTIPVTPERRAAIAARIVGVVERQMDAIERVLATVKPDDQGEGERSTRVLASIAQTLRDTAALIQPEPVRPLPDDANDDPVPRDIDEFRTTLALRIRAFVEARQGGSGADGGGTDPGSEPGGS